MRPANEADDDALWAILEPNIRAGETWALPRDWSRAEALAYWRASSHEVWVAARDENEERDEREERGDAATSHARGIVGTYFLRPAQLGPGAHIANAGYMVRPDAWGAGVASAMCDHSLVRARERGFTAMQYYFVVASNDRAVALWQRKGFAIIGRSPGAFEHPKFGPTDALVMYRSLTGPSALSSALEAHSALEDRSALEVRSAREMRSAAAPSALTIRPIEPRDLDEVRAELQTHWHSHDIWSLGRCHHADALPGYIAEKDGAFAGLITLHLDQGNWQCEVVTLSSRRAARGTGAALLAAAEQYAREHGCRRIYLTTTNDNTNAMRFYQRQGWRVAHLHAGIVDRVRTLVPDMPLAGFDGIQIRDEIEFERWLTE
jgi:ribosomal protein S18 acetylase RimI-like enzyme